MWRQTRDVLCCAEPCCVSVYMSVSQLFPCTHLSLLIFSLPINMPKKLYPQMFSTQSCGWGMAEDLATTWEIVLFTDSVSVIMQLDVCPNRLNTALIQHWFECFLVVVVLKNLPKQFWFWFPYSIWFAFLFYGLIWLLLFFKFWFILVLFQL